MNAQQWIRQAYKLVDELVEATRTAEAAERGHPHIREASAREALHAKVGEVRRWLDQHPAADVPPDCDVRKILLDVVPGEDGMGHEVYAKCVDDVVNVLTEMGEKLENAAAPMPADSQAVLAAYFAATTWQNRPPADPVPVQAVVDAVLCGDCPPADYCTDKTRCRTCPRRNRTGGV